MVLWRGRLIFSQYIKNKRHKYGIMLYMRTETSGLVITFAVYASVSVDDFRGIGNTNNVFMHLMQDRLDLGHCLYMDNILEDFWLSLALLDHLTYSTGMLCVRTS